MSEYYTYDAEYTVPPIPLVNIASTCWFNSMLQLVFRLPAFNRTVLELEDTFDKTNVLAMSYIEVLKKFYPNTPNELENPKIFADMSVILHGALAAEAKKSKHPAHIVGQQSPVWGLGDFIELFRNDELFRVFKARYRGSMTCPKCDVTTTFRNDDSLHIDMYSPVMPSNKEDFERWVMCHISDVDEFTCEKCDTKSNNIRKYEFLQMLREVIIIVCDKSERVKWYPETLSFPNKDGTNFEYEYVGSIEHSGSWNVNTGGSGHFWANVLCADGRFKKFNDMHVTPGAYEPSSSVHVIAYHMV